MAYFERKVNSNTLTSGVIAILHLDLKFVTVLIKLITPRCYMSQLAGSSVTQGSPNGPIWRNWPLCNSHYDASTSCEIMSRESAAPLHFLNTRPDKNCISPDIRLLMRVTIIEAYRNRPLNEPTCVHS